MNTYARIGLGTLVLVGVTSTLAAAQQAQTKPQTQTQTPTSVADIRKALGDPITLKATVSAVDYDDRVMVLRDDKGVDHAVYVGEDVKRLKEVKPGDKVTATFYMSLAANIIKPGDPADAGTRESAVGTGGSRPGGTASLQKRWVVTVGAIDLAQQTVEVTGEQGRRLTLKVDDPAKLARAKTGDRVEVVFTAATIVSVTK